MSRGITLGLLVAVALAVALRFPKLDLRPMHNDEAVNAIKFQALWEHGSFKYDPNEFHGPTLAYATLALSKLTGAPDFPNFTEVRLRIVTVLFGLGLILLLPLIADGLGARAIFWAALFTAISPALVFYSRYYIHEMLLLFFTFLALAAGWRCVRSRKIGWALLAGTAVGLMQATKETFVLALAAMAAALLLNHLWTRPLDEREPAPPAKFNRNHLILFLAAWFVIWLVFFSSFFSNSKGLLDSVRTYSPWLHRTAGASPHIHPWDYYLAHLAFFHTKGGPIWSEGLILMLAALGIFAAFTRKGLTGSNPAFLRFLSFYSLALAGIYSALPYKTPWCLINFWHGLVLVAGVGAVAIFQWAKKRPLKIAVGVLLLAGAGQLSLQAWHTGAWQSSEDLPKYRQNPYVYSQTSPDLLELVALVEAIANKTHSGDNLVIEVISPENDYGPLPWYLRRFHHVGWWSSLPDQAPAPVMIVSTRLHTDLEERKTHGMIGRFELRPQIFLELHVRTDLWHAYLDAAKSP